MKPATAPIANNKTTFCGSNIRISVSRLFIHYYYYYSVSCKNIVLNKSDTVTVINFYNLYLRLNNFGVSVQMSTCYISATRGMCHRRMVRRRVVDYHVR